jgi:hypothetical protein
METPRPPAPRGEGSLFRKPGSLIWTMQLYVPVLGKHRKRSTRTTDGPRVPSRSAGATVPRGLSYFGRRSAGMFADLRYSHFPPLTQKIPIT